MEILLVLSSIAYHCLLTLVRLHFCLYWFTDVHEAFDHVLDEIEAAYHTKVDYPVAEFIICFGFFVVLILEQIVLDCKEGWQKVNKILQ
jgi:hypothetical protein